MNPLQIKCEKPLPSKHGCKYEGMAFDGCHFYLTCPTLCEIKKYDKNFSETDVFQTKNPYTCICYDQKEHCFWAATKKHPCDLFKLDCSFREIDRITVVVCEDCGKVITGVSYQCKEDRLLVAFSNCIASIDKDDCKDPLIIQKCCSTCNTGILSILPSYMITKIKDCKQTINVYHSNGKLRLRVNIPYQYNIESIVFYPCVDSCIEKYHFYILATKNACDSCLLRWTIDPCDLGVPIYHCNYKICNNNSCEHGRCNCDHKKNCTDIIESIALIEAALSHILNAEGEKLQKVIACTDDIDKILCVNKAVNKMIINATHLEIVLYDKLVAVSEHCGTCCRNCDECKEIV